MGGTVVVTGAAGALGRATTAVLRSRGWTVIGVDLGDVPADGVALALGGVDLADEAAVAAAARRIETAHGAIGGLVNIAGGFAWETIADGAIETWDRLYRTNLRSALVATRAMLPLLRREGGAVVNVGAAAASKAGVGMGAYAASKAGVTRLTEALAEELKDEGVRVNAVLPSIIDTPANRADMPDAEHDRWVGPDALADAIAFLLSPAAGAITGALLPVTGRV